MRNKQKHKARDTCLSFSGGAGRVVSKLSGPLSTEPAFQTAGGLVLGSFPGFIFHKNKVQPHYCQQNIDFC